MLIEQRDMAMQGKSVAEQDGWHKEWQTFIDVGMAEYHEDGSDSNFPEIHQLLHFGEQIQRYRNEHPYREKFPTNDLYLHEQSPPIATHRFPSPGWRICWCYRLLF